jgi:hypothetical protein
MRSQYILTTFFSGEVLSAARARFTTPAAAISISLILLFSVTQTAMGQPGGRRLALVVGNQKYSDKYLATLETAENDAKDISKELVRLGFHTSLLLNLTRAGFEDATVDLVKQVKSDDVVLFYYAGHAMEDKGTNYLLPADFPSAGVKQLESLAFSATHFMHVLSEKNPKTTIVILDACRTPRVGTRGTEEKGLAAPSRTQGQFIAFATAPGKPALDGGLFSRSLTQALRVPGLNIQQVFAKVTNDVNEQSNGEQTPWTNNGLIRAEEFCFDPKGCRADGPGAAEPVTATVAGPTCEKWAAGGDPAGEGESYRFAECAFSSQKWAEAVAFANLAIQRNPNNANYFALRARAKLHLRAIPGAQEDFSAAIALDEENPEYPFELGKALADRRDYVEASKVLKDAYRLAPQRQEICIALMEVLQQTGDTKLAAQLRISCHL